ncbi:MAG: hypothetical protein KDD64_03980 [Bdellovibrionales bacterium]|nr:hypothetical protein [Bdellovibrionales bacterium]
MIQESVEETLREIPIEYVHREDQERAKEELTKLYAKLALDRVYSELSPKLQRKMAESLVDVRNRDKALSVLNRLIPKHRENILRDIALCRDEVLKTIRVNFARESSLVLK